jgi:hypothetical protein
MELKEIVRKKIREYLNENRFEKRDEEQYKSCLMSDLGRMELIDVFLKNIEKNTMYNTQEPNLDKLIDDWNGYDDQVYIQNNLKDKEIIFWEGWVDDCWRSLYLKPEYKGMIKTDAINKVINERFPRIAQEFNFKLKNFEILKRKGKYIMKITFAV